MIKPLFYRKKANVVCKEPSQLFMLGNLAHSAALVLFITTLLATPSRGSVDRNPELQSRALAWTEFDGSYIVNPHSRAEMLNFYWTVLARPYPAPEWTGSVDPIVPGTISERLRLREIAQLNAYRALTGAPPVREETARVADVQALALMLILDPTIPSRPVLSPSQPGYTAGARDVYYSPAAGEYSITFGAGGPRPTGIVRGIMESQHFPQHKLRFLNYWNDSAAYGAAFTEKEMMQYVYVPERSRQLYTKPIPTTAIVAWPSEGYYPRHSLYPPNYPYRRWVFAPADAWFLDLNWQSSTEVLLTYKGAPIPVRNLQRTRHPEPLNWEVHLDDLPLAGEADLPIDVEVRNVRMVDGSLRTYRYTVTLFDENSVVREGFTSATPLSNISTRGTVGSGQEVMIAGLVVDGTAPVRIAFRAQGPGLAAFGVQNPTRKPTLTLFNGRGETLGGNAGWRDHQDWRLLDSYGVAPSRDDEPALVATLWPGSYTVVLSDAADTNGVGILEAFNIDGLSATKLLNLSTRGKIGREEEQMIAGFTLSRRTTVLIRTQGPSLGRFGVDGVVADTVLSIVSQSDGRQIAVNDDWQTVVDSPLHNAARGFAPVDAREAAIVLTLDPGAYTALVSAKGDSGVGIVEVFQL